MANGQQARLAEKRSPDTDEQAPMADPDDQETVADLQQRARALTAELLAQAAHHFGVAFPAPTLRFDLRGKTAGQARTRDGRACEIRYNLALLARHPEDFLARTVPHETAHLVAFRLCGPRVKPHGHEWEAIMRLFGAEPSRCHNYDIAGLQTRRLRRFAYRCDCRSHQLTSIRHKRILAGQVYLCRQCGKPLSRWLEEAAARPELENP
jgi:SprT protein